MTRVTDWTSANGAWHMVSTAMKGKTVCGERILGSAVMTVPPDDRVCRSCANYQMLLEVGHCVDLARTNV